MEALVALMLSVRTEDLDRFPVVPFSAAVAALSRKEWLLAQRSIYPDQYQLYQRFAIHAERTSDAIIRLDSAREATSVRDRLQWLKELRNGIGPVNYALGQIPWLWR